MAAEWAMRLAPEPFRDFLPYTSISALKVIHTSKVLQRSLEIVQHYGSEPARAKAASTLSESLEAQGLAIDIGRPPVASLNVDALDEQTRAKIGARILGLYFHQLQSQGPWFLDLRPRHFEWNATEGSLRFFPSGLWYDPDPDFRHRVQSLYAGFYQQDRAALATGVELYSWGSTPLAGFSGRIERLLRDHFGPADASATRFSVTHFRLTFDRIFREAAESRAKLHPELTFLGVGLVGLYLTLELLQVPLDARQAFEASTALRRGPEAA